MQPPMQRVHVVIRLALLVALGTVGCSSAYWLLYLALPAFAALLISQKGAARYFGEEGPRIVLVLRWLAGAYAYLWLLTDAVPTGKAGGHVDLEVEPTGTPTPASAILRVVYGLPGLLVLAVISFGGVFLWPIGAIAILVHRRVPSSIAAFFAATLRYQFRLLAYQLSLVEQYPSLAPSVPREAHASAA